MLSSFTSKPFRFVPHVLVGFLLRQGAFFSQSLGGPKAPKPEPQISGKASFSGMYPRSIYIYTYIYIYMYISIYIPEFMGWLIYNTMGWFIYNPIPIPPIVKTPQKPVFILGFTRIWDYFFRGMLNTFVLWDVLFKRWGVQPQDMGHESETKNDAKPWMEWGTLLFVGPRWPGPLLPCCGWDLRKETNSFFNIGMVQNPWKPLLFSEK